MTEMRIEELLTKTLPKLTDNSANLVNNTASIALILKEILTALKRLEIIGK